MVWTVVEPGAVFICGCLPALWPLIAFCLPGCVMLSKKVSSGPGYGGQIELHPHGQGIMRHGNHDSILLNEPDDSVYTHEERMRSTATLNETIFDGSNGDSTTEIS